MNTLISRREWIAISAAGVAVTGCSRNGSPAPAFEATTQYGRLVRLEDFHGKPLLLTFWATWCPYCRNQLAAMEQLSNSYSGNKVALLALSLDEGGWDPVRTYLGQSGITLPVGLADAATRRAYGTSRGIPVTFVIGADGILLTEVVGGMDLPALTDLIATYVA